MLIQSKVVHMFEESEEGLIIDFCVVYCAHGSEECDFVYARLRCCVVNHTKETRPSSAGVPQRLLLGITFGEARVGETCAPVKTHIQYA